MAKTDPSDILLYESEDGEVRLDVIYGDETVWLPQKRLAELFGVSVSTVSRHLSNIFAEGELSEASVLADFAITAADGKSYPTKVYNLDAIIAVGYRVNSRQATQFRIWATRVLREFIVKGFVLDDERLKNGPRFGKDYFDELLERIREIRASERRFYQKVTDIFATAVDYSATSKEAKSFYATVQNKLHWAIHRHTAAELIAERADADKPHMGLTTWKGAPNGKVLKSDVTVAKNYLTHEELDELNRLVSMYLDYAELQAKRQRPMTMSDWASKLDAFLEFNEYDVLQSLGGVSAKIAKRLASEAYETFRVRQDREHESDFDRLVDEVARFEDDED